MMLLCNRPDYVPQEISSRQMGMVFRALAHAWMILTASGYRPTPTAAIFTDFSDENAVTDQLVMILNAMADDGNIVRGFDNSTFQTIDSGGRQPDATGTDFGNQPDFVIRPQKRPLGVASMHYGVFVECKTIDATRGLNLYITKGVNRFVEGRYAWSMKHGLMLGYVLNQNKLPHDLDTAFSRLRKQEHLPLKPISSKTTIGATFFPNVHETVHDRSGYSPQIRLDHVWLNHRGDVTDAT